jgi:hypothetical protein
MIRVALIATVHCDHAGPDGTVCRRFDEADGRPSLSTPAAGSAFARRARDTFEGRGWLITTDLTLCPDHRRSPDAPVPAPPKPTPRKGARP